MRFAEIGVGNPTLISTEVESGDAEYRIPRWEVGEFVSVYVRVVLFGVALIVDSREGVKMKGNRHAFKLLVGVVSR